MQKRSSDLVHTLIGMGILLVILIIAIALATSLVQVWTGNQDEQSFWSDPQLIAVAVGIIISVLFLDRWRALDGKVDQIFNEQNNRLSELQTFAKEHVELQVGQVIDKAEKISAKLVGINDRHPWLDVISERDMIVETDSIRGILRTAYMLLNSSQIGHLFEFLEYNSRKNTSRDTRKVKSALYGTPNDFLEVAMFCEVWLEDYALAVEYLHRFLESDRRNAYQLYPDLATRYMRLGYLNEAKYLIRQVRWILFKMEFRTFFSALGSDQPVSKRYQWHANNVCASWADLTRQTRLANTHSKKAQDNNNGEVYDREQVIFEVERLIYKGEFEKASKKLDDRANLRMTVAEMRDQVSLHERLGEHEKGAAFREIIEIVRERTFDDDWKRIDLSTYSNREWSREDIEELEESQEDRRRAASRDGRLLWAVEKDPETARDLSR